MLEENVVAERAFAFALCGRTVGTESLQFVLPCEVVGTLGIYTAGDYVGVYGCGVGCLDGVGDGCSCGYVGTENQH